MELRHLRYFVAVAEELHFRRAAERLHIAQPAVSEQIRKLEAELGVLLLNRTHRQVSLTSAGRVMLEESRRVLRQADVAQQAARRAHEGSRVRLRIGYCPDALPRVVPHALARLHVAAPHVDVELQAGAARSLLTELRGDRIDAAVVCLPAPVSGLRTFELGREDAVVAMASGTTRVASALSLEQLADSKLSLMARDFNPAFYDAIVGAFRFRELCPTISSSGAATVEQLLLEVAAGGGKTLLPASVMDRVALTGVIFRPISKDPPSTMTALVTRREEPTPILRALLRELELGVRVANRPQLAEVA